MLLTVGSLFSGVGGLDYGLLQTGGFSLDYCVETDSFCQSVIRKRCPAVTIYGDIATCSGEHATTQRACILPYTDVLVGGFPCTDISQAGRKAGIDRGEKSGLWREFARLIGEIRPRYVIVENVSALRYAREKKTKAADLGRVLGDLSSIGYDAEWLSLRASDFGAPHKRERVFIVAYCRCLMVRTRRAFPVSLGEAAAETRSGGEGSFCDPTAYSGATLENPISPRCSPTRNINNRSLPHWKDTGWEYSTDYTRRSGEGEHVAHATGQQTGWVQQRGLPSNTGTGGSLVHAADKRLPQWRQLELPTGGTETERGMDTQPERSGAMGDSCSQRCQEHDAPTCCPGMGFHSWAATAAGRDGYPVRRVGRVFDESSHWLDFVRGRYRWPAKPGEAPYDWEPPRVLPKGARRNRTQRIKALGNAVVPACSEYVGYCLLDFEKRRIA